MPTYEYLCGQCGHKFDAFQKMTDAPLNACPHCSGPLKRLIGSGSGMIFKGSGFYINDYKKGKSTEKSEKPEKNPKSGKTGETGEKPAA